MFEEEFYERLIQLRLEKGVSQNAAVNDRIFLYL